MFEEPLQSRQDRLSIRLSQCNDDDSTMYWVHKGQQDFHAMAKLYGVSSNLASDPAKSNTAEMSSDVMLG